MLHLSGPLFKNNGVAGFWKNRYERIVGRYSSSGSTPLERLIGIAAFDYLECCETTQRGSLC
jgi:hypothetical protein